MPIKGWVNFYSQQNTAGVSQEKSVAVISQTIEANTKFQMFKKIRKQITDKKTK